MCLMHCLMLPIQLIVGQKMSTEYCSRNIQVELELFELNGAVELDELTTMTVSVSVTKNVL